MHATDSPLLALLTELTQGFGRRLRAPLAQSLPDLRAAMEACGLERLEEASAWSVSMRGWSSACRVRLSEDKTGGSHTWRIEIVPRARFGFGLNLRRESLGSAVDRRLRGAREIEVGDAPFDAAFALSGVPAHVRARLDAKTRALLLRLDQVLEDLRVTEQELTCHVALHLAQPELTHLLRSLLELAEGLTDQAGVPARLAAIVRADPLPEVRMQCLLTLVRECADHAATRQVLGEACVDAHPQVRLRAAMALGERGTETLLALARDGDVTDELSARAVRALGQRGAASWLKLLKGALAAERFETARACIARLGESAQAEAVAPLGALVTTRSTALAAAAADALGALGRPEAEGPLVAALRRDSEPLAAAAARALGRCASVAVVPELRALDQRPHERDTRRAAREAIARIQARVSGATPGQVSLATADAGRLSLMTGEAGQVTLAPPNGEASPPTADST